MKIRRSFLFALFATILLISMSASLEAKNIVVPTYYGYGVINPNCGYVSPYISSLPSSVPILYSNGYYSKFAITPVIAGSVSAVPVWNGAYWYYQGVPSNSVAVVTCNLNMRSAPKVKGKNKNSNIISMLHSGEQAYVLAKTGHWYLVQSVFAPLRRGYVYGAYLRFYRNYCAASNYPVSYYTPVCGQTYWY